MALYDKEDMELIELEMQDASVLYYPNFLDGETASDLFKTLLEKTPWQADDIKVFGKTYPQPRLTALYANNERPYSYSNITMHPQLFTPTLELIKNRVEEITGTVFTTCLLNLYRDGQDSNGWHADDEKELGTNPVIASVSLGAERVFKLRRKDKTGDTLKLNLQSGSLLLMKGSTQHFWKHQIPKTKKEVGPRINLTFRVIQ